MRKMKKICGVCQKKGLFSWSLRKTTFGHSRVKNGIKRHKWNINQMDGLTLKKLNKTGTKSR
jgi:hypothetical protein